MPPRSGGSFRGFGDGVETPAQRFRNSPEVLLYGIPSAGPRRSYAYDDALAHLQWTQGSMKDADYVAYLSSRLKAEDQQTTEYLSLQGKLNQVFTKREDAHFSALGISKTDRLAWLKTRDKDLNAYLDAAIRGDTAAAAKVLEKMEVEQGSSAVQVKVNEYEKLAYSAAKDELTDARARLDVLWGNKKLTHEEYLKRQVALYQGQVELQQSFGLPTTAAEADAAIALRNFEDRSYAEARDIQLSQAESRVLQGTMSKLEFLIFEKQWSDVDLQRLKDDGADASLIAAARLKRLQLDEEISGEKSSVILKDYKEEAQVIDRAWKMGDISDEERVQRLDALYGQLRADPRARDIDPNDYSSLTFDLAYGIKSGQEAVLNRAMGLAESEYSLLLEEIDAQTIANPGNAVEAANLKARAMAQQLQVLKQERALIESQNIDPKEKQQKLNQIDQKFLSIGTELRNLTATKNAPNRVVVYNEATGQYGLTTQDKVSVNEGIMKEVQASDGSKLPVFYRGRQLQVLVPIEDRTQDKGFKMGYRTVNIVRVPFMDATGKTRMWTAIQDSADASNYFFVNPDARKPDGSAFTENDILEGIKAKAQTKTINGNRSAPLDKLGRDERLFSFQEVMSSYAAEAKLQPGTPEFWATHPLAANGPELEINTRPGYVSPPSSNALAHSAPLSPGWTSVRSDPAAAYPAYAGAYSDVERAYGVAETWDSWTRSMKTTKVVQEFDTKVNPKFYANSPGMLARGIHGGYDLSIAQGTSLKNITAGTVIEAAMNNGGWGGTVVVRRPDGVSVRYAHMSKVNVKVGDIVAPGQIVGLTGGKPGTPGAGHSDGAHLHIEMKGPDGKTLLDPRAVLASAQSMSQYLSPVQIPGGPSVTLAYSGAGAAAEASQNTDAQRIDAFLKQKGSPMAGQGQVFVDIGMKHGIDPAFLVAITGADSSFGKALKTPFNPGNVGNNDRGDKVPYRSWREGIEAMATLALNGSFLKNATKIGQLGPVTKALGTAFLPKSMMNILQAGAKYATGANWMVNVLKFMGELTGRPVSVTDTFRMAKGTSSFGSGAAASGIGVAPVTPESVRHVFRGMLFKEATQADIDNWANSGLNIGQFESRVAEYPEYQVKQQIIAGFASMFSTVPAPDVIHRAFLEYDRTKQLGPAALFAAAPELFEGVARRISQLPEGALTVDQQTRLDRVKESLRSGNYELRAGNVYMRGDPNSQVVRMDGIDMKPILDQYLAGRDMHGVAGATIPGPNGAARTLQQFTGVYQRNADGSATPLAEGAALGKGTFELPKLGAIQREYIRETGDETLAELDSFIAGLDTGQAVLPGAPQTAAQARTTDLRSTFNSYIGGEVAGTGAQAGNLQDYKDSLIRFGLTEDEAIRQALDIYKKDPTQFNKRVLADKPKDRIGMSSAVYTPGKAYAPTDPAQAEAVNSIRNNGY